MTETRVILGVNIPNFAKNSGEVQKIFTEFGCNIRTRLGLHNVTDGACIPNGLIILEIIGGVKVADDLSEKLLKTNLALEIKKMVFEK
ncbi:MAG: hypothetical protein LBT05_04640 [Planctomycetaceae bacterium]|jgi:hypothetical protein|nr:hypothetical protein [Planctomycetaceae bacterium]